MSQRVNIQYSVEIENLPSEVARLVREAEKKLKVLGATNITEGPEPDEPDISLQAVFNINEIRERLTSIDRDLLDITNIMNGYINYLSSPPQQEQTEDPPLTAEEEIPESQYGDLYPASEVIETNPSVLESKLNKFRTSNAQENHDPITTQKSDIPQKMHKSVT